MDFVSSVLSPSMDATATALALGNATSLSGGSARDDGRGSYGFSLLRGKRPAMEDFHVATYKKDPRSGQWYGLFGIFDGHGGPHAADYVRSNLFVNMMQSNKFISDLSACVAEAYETTDNQYLRQESSSGREDGCTAVTAVVVGQRLLVANVGDSRAVLCRGGKAVALSVDHKPNLKEERSRIESAGGVVVWAGTWRVGGVLAVSRAFGDRPLKRYVIPTPAMAEESLTSEDEFLILASDGLWDVMTNQEAVALVLEIKDAEQAAKRVTEEAYQRGSADNISCVVVRFR
ncbi:putative protein phosphatase 2C 59 [Pleodorina starrii]|uniref:protein-serine/threonine phosphatase n=1 Tax=Pleodorina starrii TaxID=330485 RepID=A0A9W6F7N1_9CHLO|nr:putative protein phosphatase 2C 59 [Pleodorina starrii]GLC59353.1 putative protein phosphatase 2C 59 [Pleodorina starrii]GLC74448.1 putative protein phosphatase 2C 59 [Pleodorina starrii]